MAKLFDPLGIISPLILRAKIVLQKLWSLRLAWDQAVPQYIQEDGGTYVKGLSNLNQIRVNRCVLHSKHFSLHGFANASEDAYGATIYLVYVDESGSKHSSLLFSKSRVAPMRLTTIPRLKLRAAKLFQVVTRAIQPNRVYVTFSTHEWPDSMIVLHWLKSPLKT